MDHLTLIKHHYGISKKNGTDGKWVLEPLSRDVLDLHSSFFKLTINNQATKATTLLGYVGQGPCDWGSNPL